MLLLQTEAWRVVSWSGQFERIRQDPDLKHWHLKGYTAKTFCYNLTLLYFHRNKMFNINVFLQAPLRDGPSMAARGPASRLSATKARSSASSGPTTAVSPSRSATSWATRPGPPTASSQPPCAPLPRGRLCRHFRYLDKSGMNWLSPYFVHYSVFFVCLKP